jgi:hypothetical protein
MRKVDVFAVTGTDIEKLRYRCLWAYEPNVARLYQLISRRFLYELSTPVAWLILFLVRTFPFKGEQVRNDRCLYRTKAKRAVSFQVELTLVSKPTVSLSNPHTVAVSCC